jgi:hypothetical protein
VLDLAPHFDDFLGHLFGIGQEVADLRKRHTDLAPIFAVKRLFVQRRALKAHPEKEAAGFDADSLRRQLTELFGGAFDEATFATHVEVAEGRGANTAHLDLAARYAAWATQTDEAAPSPQGRP